MMPLDLGPGQRCPSRVEVETRILLSRAEEASNDIGNTSLFPFHGP